jgi:hypothetical protein
MLAITLETPIEGRPPSFGPELLLVVNCNTFSAVAISLLLKLIYC